MYERDVRTWEEQQETLEEYQREMRSLYFWTRASIAPERYRDLIRETLSPPEIYRAIKAEVDENRLFLSLEILENYRRHLSNPPMTLKDAKDWATTWECLLYK